MMNSFLKTVKAWATPEVITLFGFIIGLFLVITLFSYSLTPVFASIVIAYLLDGIIKKLVRYGCPQLLAVLLVYFVSLGLVIVAAFGILPLAWKQARNLLNEIPLLVQQGQIFLFDLQTKYPAYFSPEQIKEWTTEFKVDLAKFGQTILSLSVSSIPGVITIIVYAVMVPLLVYFFLLDKKKVLTWAKKFLPPHRDLLDSVWADVYEQIGNYVRGRIMEMILIGAVCYVAFDWMGLHYAVLLSALVGLSVIVPYLGAVVVTIPVVIVALLQWGWGSQFATFILVYTVIIVLDANILVPLLFSGVVQLHPTAIIVALLFFGGFWGFWGVFFAIPLASLVKAMISVLRDYRKKRLAEAAR